MHASHRSTRSSGMTDGARTPSRLRPGFLFRLPLVALLGAALMGCGPQAAPSGASAGGGEERFQFNRGKVGLIRVDTRTGEVWTTPINGDGGWALRGDAPDLGDEPARNGRFGVMNIVTPRGTTRIGASAAPPPTLMRIDRATGNSWILESEDAESWTAIRDSGPSAVTPTATRESSSKAASASAPTASKTPGATSDDAFPLLTGDQLGVTPEEKQKTLKTLRMARTKEGLPQKMRVWSVQQLGEVDPDLAVPELLEVLDHEDPVLVAEAVAQLGRIGRASTIPRILKLKDHSDPGVRAAVAAVVVELN